MRLHFLIASIFLLSLGSAGPMSAGVTDGCIDDGDTVPCYLDNCVILFQAAGQFCDDDQDGYGNLCDPDFDNGGAVGAADFPIFTANWGQPAPNVADLDCGGAVGAADFPIFTGMWGQPPGPSGLACAGTPPCP